MSKNTNDPASDVLIQEVDEDLRHEEMLKVWKRFAPYILGVALLLIMGVAGQQVWKNYQAELRVKESTAFAAAALLGEKGKGKEAEEAFAKLASEAKTGQGVLAKLRQASLQASSGDIQGAVAACESVVANKSAPQVYRDLAVIKIGLLTIDSAEPGALFGRLAPIAAAGPWRHSALEMQALLSLRQGDVAKARALYSSIADAADAPRNLRGRAAEMLAALGRA